MIVGSAEQSGGGVSTDLKLMKQKNMMNTMMMTTMRFVKNADIITKKVKNVIMTTNMNTNTDIITIIMNTNMKVKAKMNMESALSFTTAERHLTAIS